MKKKELKIAYCTGFWCTNIGNAFFSMGVEYVLKKILGKENVTIVSDYQTYTTSYGKRLYPHKRQYEYLTKLDVDYIVLAGPVLSKYFLLLYRDILMKLKERNIGYIILSAGIMKMTPEAKKEIITFFKECPPAIFTSRDEETYKTFGKYAINSYNGICFSFFTPDCYHPSLLIKQKDQWTLNLDKIKEPVITKEKSKRTFKQFSFKSNTYYLNYSGLLTNIASKTDRFTDALIYLTSVFPSKQVNTNCSDFSIVRTDHRFHPHFRNKIYSQRNSFCADLPYGYLNIYANSDLTISDRVHACAVTLAYGNSAMLLSKTNRSGLLERVGAAHICEEPVKIDLIKLKKEKESMMKWLEDCFTGISEAKNEDIN